MHTRLSEDSNLEYLMSERWRRTPCKGDETQSREASQVPGPVRVAWGVPHRSPWPRSHHKSLASLATRQSQTSDPTTEAERLPEAVKEAAAALQREFEDQLAKGYDYSNESMCEAMECLKAGDGKGAVATYTAFSDAQCRQYFTK